MAFSARSAAPRLRGCTDMRKRVNPASNWCGADLVTALCIVLFLLVFAAASWLVYQSRGNSDVGWPADTLRDRVSRSTSGGDEPVLDRILHELRRRLDAKQAHDAVFVKFDRSWADVENGAHFLHRLSFRQ
jgi:hypothetical protein